MAPHCTAILLILFLWKFDYSHGQTRDHDFEAYLLEVLNNFRSIMKVGIPEIKVPVLDPLRLYDIKINVNEKEATVRLVFPEINVHNLSTFKVETLHSNLADFYAKFNLTFPHIRASGRYDLDGKILKIFPLYGKGDFEVQAINANIGALAKMILDQEGLRFTTLTLDLTWKNLSVNFENLLKGGQFSKVLQKIFPALGKGLFDHFKPEILRLINNALINEVNKELQKPEVKKIIEGLIPKND